MVGHMGDPGLGLAALGDVDNRDQIAVAVLEGDAPSKRQHLDLAAIGPEMPPVAPRVIGIADLLQSLGMADPLILRPDFLKLHAQECLAAISVMLHRCVIDVQEPGGLGVEHHIGIGLLSNSRRNEASRLFSAVTSEIVSERISPNAVTPNLRLRSSLSISNCSPLPLSMMPFNRSMTPGRHSRFPPALS